MIRQLLAVVDTRDGESFCVAEIVYFDNLRSDPHNLSNRGGLNFLRLQRNSQFVLTDQIKRRVPVRLDPAGQAAFRVGRQNVLDDVYL